MTLPPQNDGDPPSFGPFKSIYDDVRKGIAQAAANEAVPGSAWLLEIDTNFKAQQMRWGSATELADYVQRWGRYRTRLAQLVLGAFLHVSYDLPRVLADDWPADGKWAKQGLNEENGYFIYASLKRVFSESFARAAKRYASVGFWSALLWIPSSRLLAVLNVWVLYLRLGAWEHGRILAADPAGRPARERAMALALTAAIEDVSDYFPWSYAQLGPPDDALRSSVLASLGAFGLLLLNYISPFAAVIAAVFSVLAYSATRRSRRYRNTDLFINRLGDTIDDYMGAAVRRPHEFESYLARRRGALGLRSERTQPTPT